MRSKTLQKHQKRAPKRPPVSERHSSRTEGSNAEPEEEVEETEESDLDTGYVDDEEEDDFSY